MRTRSSRTWRVVKALTPLLVGGAVLVLAIAWLAGALDEKIAPGTIPADRRDRGDRATALVEEVEQEYQEEAVGTLRAASRSVVSARVMASVEEVSVSAGDRVNEGALLVRLESQEFEARLNQAKEALNSAIARHRDAGLSFERSQALYEQKVVSRQEFDTAVRNLDTAKADEAQARQTVAEAEALLAYTVILAPRSGRIVDRMVEAGDTVRAGDPLLVLYDSSSLRLEAPVLEHRAVQLRVGQELDVSIDALQREVRATIDEIVPQADIASRSFLVKASLPRSDDLFEGMFGRLRIPAGTRRHLCLATAAIQRVGQLEFVEVERPGGQLEKRYIQTGRSGSPGTVEVLSGLQAGERVVLQPGTGGDPAARE